MYEDSNYTATQWGRKWGKIKSSVNAMGRCFKSKDKEKEGKAIAAKAAKEKESGVNLQIPPSTTASSATFLLLNSLCI